MTADEFRRMALNLKGAEERAHMNHPDFRVANRIFATLGYPDKEWGMVSLTPEQQAEFMHDEPEMFVPAAGAWGKKGSTTVRLSAAKKDALESALQAAWANAQAKPARKAKPAKKAKRAKKRARPRKAQR